MLEIEEIKNKVINSDCLDILKELPDNSIDTIITDPPYGLSFMSKKWDYDIPSIEIWKECLRVLKYGGTALIFGGSRTYHRMACAVEDAGFLIKDCIMWIYGSGFPKATDISNQIDKPKIKNRTKLGKYIKLCGKTRREISKYCGVSEALVRFWEIGERGIQENEYNLLTKLIGKLPNINIQYTKDKRKKIGEKENSMSGWDMDGFTKFKNIDILKGTSLEAKTWEGWKSHGLKPAYEPIIVAMKQNEGSYSENALKWGVSGLNIDECRIDTDDKYSYKKCGGSSFGIGKGNDGTREYSSEIHNKGRFPANIILDEEAGKELDKQSGNINGDSRKSKETYNSGMFKSPSVESNCLYNDKGGASRFFYCAKASKSERNEGCEGLEDKIQNRMRPDKKEATGLNKEPRWCPKISKNNHPTVKPLKLMEYLCKLTKTPEGGIVLDLFAGSGTTLLAALNVGRDFIGIEKEKEYCEIAEARIRKVSNKLFT
jgi:site-specific DNA-methyltransferase (adenine-specific)